VIERVHDGGWIDDPRSRPLLHLPGADAPDPIDLETAIELAERSMEGATA
jgi:hypothetical protein